MNDIIFDILKDFVIAFAVGYCWAIFFGVPKNILWIAGLLGGLGHCLRFILIHLDFGLITATLTASILIGLVGIVVSKMVYNPPFVFTMPACITMVPGLFAYKTMLAGIKLTDMPSVEKNPHLLLDMGHNLMLTLSLLFALAVGICIGALLFRKKTTKDISLSQMLENITYIIKRR